MGIRTSNLASSASVTELVGHTEIDGNKQSALISFDNLAAQIEASRAPDYETLAELLVDLDWVSGSLGRVWGDATLDNRGVYQKSGNPGAGAWTRLGPLPETDLSRSLRVPSGESITEFPDAATRANTVPMFDADGNPTTGPTAAQITSAEASASAAAAAQSNAETAKTDAEAASAAAAAHAAALSAARFTVATITELTALAKSALTNNDVSFVTDGARGGYFRWIAADTSTANGGTIFAADEGGDGRWLREYSGKVMVSWFGINGPDMRAAFELASSLKVPAILAADDYYWNADFEWQPPATGLTIIGAGPELSIIHFDNENYNVKGMFAGIDDIAHLHLKDFAIIGLFGEVGSTFEERKDLINLTGIEDLRVTRVKFKGSYSGSLVTQRVKKASVIDCEFENSYRDACRIMQAVQVNVIGNKFLNCLDDSIAVSTIDTYTAELHNSVVISNNNVIDSSGIVALGGKSLTVTGNVVIRPIHRGIKIGPDVGFETGNSPILSLVVDGNIVQDPIAATAFDPSGGVTIRGLDIFCPQLSATDIVETYSGGAVVAPYPYLYNKDFDDTGVNAGHYNIVISNNVVTRTLDAAASYSSAVQDGPRLSRVGWVDPEITLAHLQADQMVLSVSGNGLLVTGNQCDGGNDAIKINPSAAANGVAMRNFVVSNNVLKNYASDGLLLFGNGHVEVRNNVFDGDPYHLNADRGAGGTWGAGYTSHTGVNIASSSGLFATISGNTFKNVGYPVYSAGTDKFVSNDNMVHCDPVATGYDAANIGVGFVHSPALGFKPLIEDGDPDSTTFKQIKNICLTASVDTPTTGKYVGGDFLPDPSGLYIGRHRLTTSSNHVEGTDWKLFS